MDRGALEVGGSVAEDREGQAARAARASAGTADLTDAEHIARGYVATRKASSLRVISNRDSSHEPDRVYRPRNRMPKLVQTFSAKQTTSVVVRTGRSLGWRSHGARCLLCLLRNCGTVLGTLELDLCLRDRCITTYRPRASFSSVGRASIEKLHWISALHPNCVPFSTYDSPAQWFPHWQRTT